ncbi:DUF6689 family protein [Lysobacter sp. 1R34A]|uniref:DUF6689 family protein n=1 Tax=Lysobacter sp. 1R34A TaxID=3445786 RepID=UPI003EEFE66F
MGKFAFAWRLLAAAALSVSSAAVSAQSLPVTVDASGTTATIVVGDPALPLADLTLSFDDASGLQASSLGVSAQLVSLSDSALLARLPGLGLTPLDPAFPVLITIEPPALGGLSFHRSVRVEVHTHALSYSAGSSYRLFKAPLGGSFRDISDEIAPGSVRARGTTGGFSQFLVLPDLRPTGSVIAQKIAWLRGRVDLLPPPEQPSFDAWLDTVASAVAAGQYADAITALDAFRARAVARAGSPIADRWRAARDLDNQAGELIAGAATLKFSVAYLRDFGQ